MKIISHYYIIRDLVGSRHVFNIVEIKREIPLFTLGLRTLLSNL
jgi:hypothetical protein